ncbi:MAG: hypothetical protein AMXMBFR12_07220 [Candidatus Babeliales bacterium]
MARYWIAVASKEHVIQGVEQGICQVCHGKVGPLRAMSPGDWIIYYSPVELFGSKIPCRQFTAIGQIAGDAPYQFRMSDDFIPWRRDVIFYQSKSVAIEPLLDTLSFIQDRRHWGFIFRRGCFKINAQDFARIAKEMGVMLNEKKI